MKGVYKFHWGCGRAGDLEGVFVADDKEVQEVIGEEVYFGEVLGKHSEIYGTLDEEDITLISTDEKVVKLVEEYKLSMGFNPITRYQESREDDE
jgi:hypothetical protein